MRTYNIIGSEITQRNSIYDKYNITLINNEHIYINTLMRTIDIIDFLTVNKHITIFNEFGFQTTIFRKHIVKITEVK